PYVRVSVRFFGHGSTIPPWPSSIGSCRGSSAPPGYEVYYLNVMAGPRREWKVTFDPDHERLRA
ncbi:MAG TPA: 5-deoxy-glucuronate isomerase, partial [Candidatus Limnocylindria bacterium]